MTDTFEGKIVIVTGGTSGIGYAVSEALLKRGAYVWVIGSRMESVEKAKQSLAEYPNAQFAAVDVTLVDEVQKMVDDCVNAFDRLDYLFNNAGVGSYIPTDLATLDHWKRVVDVNLWSVIYGVHAALPVMLKQGSGHIVNTASIAGLFSRPYRAVYTATKHAVKGMTESMRYEFAGRDTGIAFSTVCPGNVVTKIFDGVEIPKDAIPVDEAAEIILAGVEKKEGMIIFPENTKKLIDHLNANPNGMEKFMMELERRSMAGFKNGVPYLELPHDIIDI
jgi:NAD(P)-dependent dehydrogenase (short-subunit alcohol dehydrogenase family)